VLLYWIGSEGRNGKSTVIKVLQDILGPYATRMDDNLINAHPVPSFKKDDALAASEGKSLYIFNEIDERMVASTRDIKTLTEGGRDEYGNKVMTVVRPAYSRAYEMNISGTPLIIANSLLNMGEWSNLAPIFKRLVLVSFDYKITVEDPTILNRLAQEYPKIQLWLYLNYFEHKGVLLKDAARPKEFADQLKRYYDESDIIKMFWEDCFTVTNNQADTVLRGNVYKMYCEYCKVNGRKPIKNKGTNGFANLIKGYFPGVVNHSGNYFVTGVKQSAYYLNEVV
jgi:putative DNA primase/helicase